MWKERYKSISDSEAHLHRNGTRILKFFLHLSKEEQRQRLLARIDEPDKNWKFSEADIAERGHWDDYQEAYAAALGAAAGAGVLDAHVVGQLGGTGVALDWSGLQDAVAALRAAVPGIRVILAGGLRPANVSVAIRLLSPDVVDVSSGVECNTGFKDPVLVEQFVAAVRSAAGMSQ